MKRLLAACAITGCLLSALPVVTNAQGLPGLTIFSGVKPEKQLPFRLDYGGQPNGWDRYNLRIPAEKMKTAASQFIITYPKTYEGDIDPKKIAILIKDKNVRLSEVRYDKKSRTIEIFPEQPIPARSNLVVELSNVKNPPYGGMHYFNCSIIAPGGPAIRSYLGTWILAFSN
jgi:Protein of unknown function (DUF2808)